MRYKFLPETKIAYIEEFLKRKLHIKPVESIFLFDKHRKYLLSSGSTIQEVAERQALSRKGVEADCEITMRLTETYG